jgi:hypothetical protein
MEKRMIILKEKKITWEAFIEFFLEHRLTHVEVASKGGSYLVVHFTNKVRFNTLSEGGLNLESPPHRLLMKSVRKIEPSTYCNNWYVTLANGDTWVFHTSDTN